jgi:hypothetical protein
MAEGDNIEERIQQLSKPLRDDTGLGVSNLLYVRPKPRQLLRRSTNTSRNKGRAEWFEVGVIEARQMLDELASRAINFRPEESRIHPRSTALVIRLQKANYFRKKTLFLSFPVFGT